MTCSLSRGNLFSPNDSTTWQKDGIYSLSVEENLGYTYGGEYGSDMLTLNYPGPGALGVDRQVLAGIIPKDFYVAAWGIAPKPTNLSGDNSTTFYQSLLSSLKKMGQVPSLSYGYTAGAYYRR